MVLMEQQLEKHFIYGKFVNDFFKTCFNNLKIECGIDSDDTGYDYIINNIAVELKYSRDGNLFGILKYKNYLNRDKFDKFLFISNCYYKKKEQYEKIRQSFIENGIEVILLNHILYIVEQTSADLTVKLNSCLDFSTADIIRDNDIRVFERLGLSLNSDILFANVITNKYKDKPTNKFFFDVIDSGHDDCYKYERECKKLIEHLFSDSLVDIREQEKINEDMGQVDFIARIKDNVKSFWKLIYDRFRTNFVVFEAKNYTNKITQNNIYITEKYLYDTALRNVAIIFTRKGADENAIKALKGVLREHGKLFIILDNRDVEELIKIHEGKQKDFNDPSDYLLAKANELLINLGK